MHDTSAPNEPWYKNPWVWLIIAIPALTVAGCALTIYLAVTNPETLVADAPAPVAESLDPLDAGPAG